MTTTPPVVEARRAHSSRCRQRVIKALNDAVAGGEEISVSSIAPPELLGEQAWQQSGLGAPPDIHALQQRITELEQANVELRRELADRDDDLEAARATNRELINTLNRTHTPG